MGAAGAGAGAAGSAGVNAGWNVNFNPPGAQIQQALDKERAELNLALACCGIHHNDACKHLMDSQGITSEMSLAWMTDKHIEKMIKYHNSGLTTVAMRPMHLAWMHCHCLYTLAFHVRQHQAQGKPFVLAEWFEAKADETLQCIQLLQDGESMNPPSLRKIRTGLD